MAEETYLGITRRYSRNGLFMAEIHKTLVMEGKNFYSATISKKVRSFWQPLLSGVGLTDAEIESYFTQDV